MLTQGLSVAFMHCFVAAGSTILQACINSLGSLVIAGHTAAGKSCQFFYQIIANFSQNPLPLTT